MLANDSDVDGPQLSVALVGLPQHGQIELQPDGSFRYEPDGIFSGIDQFQYQVDDGLGAIAAAVAAIVVRPVDPTVIITVEDDLFGFEGPNATIAEPGVLANDRVTGAPALSATLIVPPETGTVHSMLMAASTLRGADGFSGQVWVHLCSLGRCVSELHGSRSTTHDHKRAAGGRREQFGVPKTDCSIRGHPAACLP